MSPDRENGHLPLATRWLISGKSGGTGASTTANLLAEHLQLPVISGGKYFRAFAAEFHQYQQAQRLAGELETENDIYNQFLKKCQEILAEQKISGLLEFLKTGLRTGADGEILANFSLAIAKATPKSDAEPNADTFWDTVVDQVTIAEALSKPGFVSESKLAILKLELDEMQPVVSLYDGLALPYLKVLLSLDPKLAAQRIGQRENRAVSPDEVTTRQLRDFARYKNYHLQGKPVSFEDLTQHADVIIDTSQRTPDQVAVTAVEAYLHKIRQLSINPFLAQPLIEQLSQALVTLHAENRSKQLAQV